MDKRTPTIRPIRQEELDILIELCVEHAAYEQAEYHVDGGKKDRLAEAIFRDPPRLYCLVALQENRIIGYASYTLQYATWDAREYLYLDGLYLLGSARGHGIGEQLMQRVYEAARQLNCEWIQWQTPDFNHRAIKFYKRLGAFAKTKERFFWKIEA